MVYILANPTYSTNMSFGTSGSLSSLASSSSQNSLPSPTPTPPRRTRSKPLFDLVDQSFSRDAQYGQASSSGSVGISRTPLKALATPNAMLTMPVPPQLKPIAISSSSRSSPSSPSPTFPSDKMTPSPPAPLSNVPRRRNSIIGRSAFQGGVNRGAGLRLDLGDLTNGGPQSNEDDEEENALPTPPKTAPATVLTTPQMYVRPTAAQLAARQRQRSSESLIPSTSSPIASPSYIRKKSGELVKSSLKTVSMFNTPRTGDTPSVAVAADLIAGLRVDTSGGPPLGGGYRSEPTTPLGPKMVHFDVKLEHVKHFLAEQRPSAVSRDGSPTETSEGGEDYLSYKRNGGYGTNSDGGRSSEDEKVRKTLTIHVMNMPSTSSLDALKANWSSEHVRLEGLSLAEDGRSVKGTVLVRNLAFGKRIAVRFTMDKWQTTSEVTGKHVCGVENGAFDRFEFCIRLADYLGGRIWEKTLEIAVRYSADGHGEMWDSNGGQNYVVQFRRRSLPMRSASQAGSEDEEELSPELLRKRNEQVGIKVAQLKKSLEKLVPAPVFPVHARQARFGSALDVPRQNHSPTKASSPSHLPFVNNRSAAEILQRVGKHGSPSAMNRSFFLAAEPALPPPSPKRTRDDPLASRYDLGSSLRNAAAGSPTTRAPPSSVPFPSSPSHQAPVASFKPAGFRFPDPSNTYPSVPGQTFTSNPVTFNMRSTARGSPRDALTPGHGASPGMMSPFRTSSDSDIPASFQSGASPAQGGTGSGFGNEMNSLAWSEGIARDSQRSYFALSPSNSEWETQSGMLGPSPPMSSMAGSGGQSYHGYGAQGASTQDGDIAGFASVSARADSSPQDDGRRTNLYLPLLHPTTAAPASSSEVDGQTATISEQHLPYLRFGGMKPLDHDLVSPSRSADSSSTSSPALTTDSTAVSSPMSPPEPLFGSSSMMEMDSNSSSSSYDRRESSLKAVNSFLDGFRSHHEQEGPMISRRSYSASSIEDFLGRSNTVDPQSHSSSDSGHTTPRAATTPITSRMHSPAPPESSSVTTVDGSV